MFLGYKIALHRHGLAQQIDEMTWRRRVQIKLESFLQAKTYSQATLIAAANWASQVLVCFRAQERFATCSYAVLC